MSLIYKLQFCHWVLSFVPPTVHFQLSTVTWFLSSTCKSFLHCKKKTKFEAIFLSVAVWTNVCCQAQLILRWVTFCVYTVFICTKLTQPLTSNNTGNDYWPRAVVVSLAEKVNHRTCIAVVCITYSIVHPPVGSMTGAHTHTHNRFTALWNLSGKTRVSRYQKNIHPLLSS